MTNIKGTPLIYPYMILKVKQWYRSRANCVDPVGVKIERKRKSK
jgi:hypothetical protein